MLRPSYAELMDILNEETGENDEVTSRYTIVIAAAKRARQLIDGDEPMVAEKKGKPLSTAVEEIAESKIMVVPEGEGTELEIYKRRPESEENADFSREDEEPLFDITTVEKISSSNSLSMDDFDEEDDDEDYDDDDEMIDIEDDEE